MNDRITIVRTRMNGHISTQEIERIVDVMRACDRDDAINVLVKALSAAESTGAVRGMTEMAAITDRALGGTAVAQGGTA